MQALKPAEQDEFLDSSLNLDPCQRRSDSNLDRASHDSILLESREPDGASSEGYPAVSEEDHNKDGRVVERRRLFEGPERKGKESAEKSFCMSCSGEIVFPEKI